MRAHQPLPHGAVGGLAKIAALGVLGVRAPSHQGDLHIGDRRAGQHARMAFFHQVGQDQPLIAALQHLVGAVGGKVQAAAALAGLQQQMYLGIVAQRFIMPRAADGRGDGLAVKNAALAKAGGQAEAVTQHAAEDFQLYLAHQLHVDFTQPLVPQNVQLRVFLL